jgi:hypothetical protein
VVSTTPRPLSTPGKEPVSIVQEAGWTPGPVWTGAINLAPTGIRSPDRPARSQSLYRLSYPAHAFHVKDVISKCKFLTSNFHHFLNAVFFLLGDSPVSEFSMLTFRIILFHLHIRYKLYTACQDGTDSVPKRRNIEFRRRGRGVDHPPHLSLKLKKE